MNFSKYASNKSSSANQTEKAISAMDFEILMESAEVELGDFNMGRALNSFYWSAVGGVFGAIQDQYGDHAPTYIASKEKQQRESSTVVHWLHSEGFLPEEGEGSTVKDICEFFIQSNPLDIEIELALVIEDHMRELKKSNRLLSSNMETKKLVAEFKQCPADVVEEYTEIAQNNLDTKVANQKNAMEETIKTLEWAPANNVLLTEVAPSKLYYIVSKLSDKLGDWIQADELKKKKEARTQNKGMVKLLAGNLELMDKFQERVTKLLEKADEVDNSNNIPEITDAYDQLGSSVNDNTDADRQLRDRDYNGGYNI